MKYQIHTIESVTQLIIIDNRLIYAKGLELLCKENMTEVSTTIVSFQEAFKMNDQGFTNGIKLISANGQRKQELRAQVKQFQTMVPTKYTVIYDWKLAFQEISAFLPMGIEGYLSSEFDISELIRCIATLERGSKYISNSLVWSHFENDSVHSDQTYSQLTPLEKKVATNLIEGINVTTISRELNRKISTISTVKRNIFNKLHVENIIELREYLKGNASLIH